MESTVYWESSTVKDSLTVAPHETPKSGMKQDTNLNNQSTEEKSPWVTKLQLARHFGVGKSTIDEWQSTRRIPFRRYSSRLVRFHLEKCEEALKVFDIIPRRRP